MSREKVEVGDVVQMSPEGNPKFGPSFVVVTEVKSWGIQGYVQVPGETGVAYVRVNKADYVWIGKAEWALASLEE